MELKKKGIVLTLVTIVILSIFAASYMVYTLYEDRSAINSRITTLNNFVTSIDKDISRQLYISSYRAIFLFNKKIVDTGFYISDVNASLNEIFFNGTLDGINQELMQDATFSSIQNFFSNNAQKINAQIEFQNPAITISQEDPWNVKIIFNSTLVIQDENNLASWNKSSSTIVKIPITNFDDPIYSVNTGGKLLNKINQTPYQTFVTGSDFSNLQSHFQNSFYKTSTSAPNFLMRLQGNLSSSPIGIESLVNPQTLADVGISAKYKSVVDYIYFSNENPPKYSVPQVENLILDDEDNHLQFYNVSGIATPI